jgi:hypothetical protein
MLALLLSIEQVVLADPTKWLIDLDAAGPGGGLREYPWLAAALLDLPLRSGVPTIFHYFAVIVACLLAVDGAMTVALWRAGGKRLSSGLWLWLLTVPALGPLAFARYDLLPAVITAFALLAVANGRAVGGGLLVAIAGGLKIWPFALLPALLLPETPRARARLLGALLVCAGAIAVAALLAAGSDRLVSPFAMQGERGLQIEAFVALPFLWLRYFDGGSRWTVRFAACHCHEIFGPGVDVALHVTSLLVVAGAAFVALLYVRAFQAPAPARSARRGALLAALTVLVWVAGARVFSPQYLLWLAAPLAVFAALPGAAPKPAEVALLVGAAALTHFIYPLTYEALIVERHAVQSVSLAALSMRDALLLALGWRLGRRALDWA